MMNEDMEGGRYYREEKGDAGRGGGGGIQCGI